MVPTPYLQGTLINGVVGRRLYFNNNPDVDQRSFPGIRHCFRGLHELQRTAGRVAKAGFQWPGRPGGLYLVALPDQQQRILRNLGSRGWATPASPYYQNLYNPHGDYASCYYDSSNIVSAYATYDLPVGG